MKKLTKLLNSKKYSKFIRTKIPLNPKQTFFINPQDDSFILFSSYYSKDQPVGNFYFTNIKMIEILTQIVDNYINDFENILLSKNYFRLEIEIPKKYYKFYPSSIKKIFRKNIILYTVTFDDIFFKIVNNL